MPDVPDAILVCGGEGLRLRSVTGDLPKAMASVGGRPFLELLLRQLSRHRFKRAILAVGYQKDVISSYFGDRACGLRLLYSVESSPLGTGGAVGKAAGLVESGIALVMNGDSYTQVDLSAFVNDYVESGADASILLVPADGRCDCGFPSTDEHGRVISFEEKPGAFPAPHLNAGIYLMSLQLLRDIPPGLNISLERELFPGWLQQGKYIRGFLCTATSIDIGTPERYQNAQRALASVEQSLDFAQRDDQL